MNILHIDCNARPDSYSRQLSAAIVDQLLMMVACAADLIVIGTPINNFTFPGTAFLDKARAAEACRSLVGTAEPAMSLVQYLV